MLSQHFKSILILVAFTGATSAFATPLSDYNLILSGDYSPSGGSGHVHGKSFIGGNLNGQNPVLSQGMDKSLTSNTSEVAGNINASSLKVDAGELFYGGDNNAASVSCNGTPYGGSSSCLKQQTGLAAKRTNLVTELQTESDYFKSLTPTGSITGDSNNKTFSYTGLATDLAVFTITGAQLFAGNSWDISFGNAQKMVINVSGTVLNSPSNVNLNGSFNNNYSFSNVLWNFFEATSINFSSGWAGSVVALNATINSNSNFDGAVAAKAYIGNGEIHDYHWNYAIPAVSVPEPSNLYLFLFGLGLIVVGSLRKRLF